MNEPKEDGASLLAGLTIAVIFLTLCVIFGAGFAAGRLLQKRRPKERATTRSSFQSREAPTNGLPGKFQ
jgi:hypothetical protein